MAPRRSASRAVEDRDVDPWAPELGECFSSKTGFAPDVGRTARFVSSCVMIKSTPELLTST